MPRRGRVGVAKPFCADPPPAKCSAEKLLGEGFAVVVFDHGLVLRSGGKAALRDAVYRRSY